MKNMDRYVPGQDVYNIYKNTRQWTKQFGLYQVLVASTNLEYSKRQWKVAWKLQYSTIDSAPKTSNSTSSSSQHHPVSPSSIADQRQHLPSLILRVYYTLISKVSITPLCDYVGSWMGPIIENSDGGGWIFFAIEHVDASTVRAVQIW